MRVTEVHKGESRAKVWIVHMPDGTKRGFPAHLYTKEQAIKAAKSEME